MTKQISIAIVLVIAFLQGRAQLISSTPTNFDLSSATIVVDQQDFSLVQKAAALLQQDILAITGKKIPVQYTAVPGSKNSIVIGSLSQSSFIKALAGRGTIKTDSLQNKWEAFQVQRINNQLIIAGSDRRGTAFGVLELSRQMGVSPWYWWADVPVKKQSRVFIKENVSLREAPGVKYRGIFINDEAPALSGWSKEKFGGFNHQFYEHVFELILRLKGNYLWPAMWGNAFYDDDSLNIQLADQYGIVMGTSHHEPLMKAHDEWRRYGSGKWNYDSNSIKLKAFWKAGMERATNEKIVTVGMRGDGDEPMSRQTATTLLEKIVTDQRAIIETVTGKPATETPQLWALYKEVQDYYDKGMRVPDDITLLLCDDNWGNIRRLPLIGEKQRQGGYGIYYHYDYVGGPRNYKWLNTNTIERTWEQMHLAWEYNARQIWIVNVGDIKPMEFPIAFFLDYAWNPAKIGANDLDNYTTQWAAAQFGPRFAKDIAAIISAYTKFNARKKPELLDANTYSLPDEWSGVVNDYNALLKKAIAINDQLPGIYRDSFFQLVLHPVKACANLNELYYNVALNKAAYNNRWKSTNGYADKVKELYRQDSLITVAYHQMNNGKWNHMMDQTHIGYTYWQQPERQKMPVVKYLPLDSARDEQPVIKANLSITKIPAGVHGNVFYEAEGKGVSIEADHYTKAINSNAVGWKILPGHGRTGAAITSFPVTAPEQQPGSNTPQLQYDFYTYSKDSFHINAYFSPTLNFQNTPTGLQYAIAVDDEAPQLISINKDDNNAGKWNKWVADNIIIKTSQHHIIAAGKHTVKYWMVNSGVVLQKLVLDFGATRPSYLGPPETRQK